MSRSGRQQILLSIYGAANEGKNKSLKKPHRPSTNSSLARRASSARRPAPFVCTDSERHQDVVEREAKHSIEDQPVPIAVIQTPPPPGACAQVTQTPRSGTSREGRISEGSGNVATITKEIGGTAVISESAVISLYGDGFLEIPLSKGPEDTEPSKWLGKGGFSISMLLFKAADTEKHRARVEKKDGARHTTPELDDTGDFVRWLCCGSTDRNIFGCFASADEGSVMTHKPGGLSNGFQGFGESTPKLLSAKLHTESFQDDEATFSIYDRGVHVNYREIGEDGGCRVRWRGWECWVNNYEVPNNRWVTLKVVFDCRYLQIFFDDELVDCARIHPIEDPSTPSSGLSRGRRVGNNSAWVQTPSCSNSVYVGGHPSYARSVRDWRARIGFVGLISSFRLWKLSNDQQLSEDLLISLTIPEVGSVRDNSTFANVVNAHRNVFWRLNAPPIWTPISEKIVFCGVSPATKESVVLLANFFDGAHWDVGVPNANSFENLLLTVVQSGDIRVVIEYATEYSVQRCHDHVCRSQAEYEQKTSALIAAIEQVSPLLTVSVNSVETRSPTGSFEITMELTRATGRNGVVLVLHSMNSSGCFPKLEDIKRKIASIILFEAKRSPGEEIQIQAFRHLLALAGQTRHNRERTFMESVINRKLVLTERKVAAEFEKIGFFFASTELQDVVSYLKRIQDNYSRTHNHRMDDLPSLSMLTPTPGGLYTLPFMNTLLVSSTIMGDNGRSKSPWRFVCVLVDYDFQLVDFVHEGCPVTKRRGISYRQGQSTYNGVVDRLYLRLTGLSSRVFCVLLSIQKIAEDESNDTRGVNGTGNLLKVRVQMENVEKHQVLGKFDAQPHANCRWFTLAAVYRSKKNNRWLLQAIGGCGNATSIHASIDEVNVLLAELRIIQTYEIRVYYIGTGSENDNPTTENQECEEFVSRLTKNIRFGRNGRIVLVSNGDKVNSIRLRIALKLQEMENEIDVYTHHNSANRTLPTIQSVYRTILRILSQHGIKECLQQNPFAPQNKNVKRHVEFRVVSAQTNVPVEKVHVFIEKNVSLGSNLSKAVLPTLMMGSRLMSIRRRLQKKRVTEIVREVAESFVAECITKASKRATIATSLNVKLISVVRARALLRKVMRHRYEKIKRCIIERARKSEHAREYSLNFPIRLQKLYANSLELSDSERDLLQNSTREELAELDRTLRGVPVPVKEKTAMDENLLLEEWTKKTSFASDDIAEDDSKDKVTLSNNQTSLEYQSSNPEETSNGIVKDRRQLLVTDTEGRAISRLVPGSYSLYVFHLDYFEWTSLVAVYPTISASRLSSGPTTATSSVQEIVIPLDVYRWTYSLQLVDYFHPHVNVKLAGIPLQITNSCSSERQIVVTDTSGCATWDVSKGLYAVDVLRECSCVLYSALKQVVVDGGRYRTSRTIPMPVLFGGVKVTVLVVTTRHTTSDLANVKFHAASSIRGITSVAQDKRRNARIPLKNDVAMQEEPSEGDVSVGSSRAFKLQLSTYRLKVTSNDYFPVSLPVKVTWASSKTQANDGNRYLAVLSPTICTERTFRVILSYVDEAESMDLILEVWKDKTMVGHVWRQNSDNCIGHVQLEMINSLEECEYQSLLLYCQQGFTYKCIAASNLSITQSLRPHVQIYSSAGLVYQCSDPPSIGELYWHLCSWDINGHLVSTTSCEAENLVLGSH